MKKKLPLADLQNLPQCAADFIKLVIKKMRYRKKVRTEVMAELTAHFEDELKVCQGDQEKQQKARELIEEFGNVKLLGILLRRAKKRCRPLWRTMVARGFQAVGILILSLIIYIGWFFSGKPVITTDYVAELNRMVQPTADESLNAAPLYNQAFELIKEKPKEISMIQSIGDYENATPEQKQLIKEWITDNNEALQLVIAGTKKPYYWQRYQADSNIPQLVPKSVKHRKNAKKTYYLQKYHLDANSIESIFTTLMPKLAKSRQIAYALCWRAQINAEKGQYKNAFDDLLALYRLGQHCKSNLLLIEQLVGIALRAVSTNITQSMLDKYKIEPDILAELQRNFGKLIGNENFLVNFEGERLRSYDEIQRCFTEDRLGGGHLYIKRIQQSNNLSNSRLEEIFSEGEKWLMPLHILFTHPNKQESFAMAENFYSFLEKIIYKNPGQIKAESIDINEEAKKIIKGNLILEMLTTKTYGARLNDLSHRSKTDIEATLTIIAILRYKQQNGNYPENLKELITAGLLKKLPIDAYSNKPLIYKQTKDNFILYSIGSNFTDDGGVIGKDSKGKPRVWADNGDAVFWPVRK